MEPHALAAPLHFHHNEDEFSHVIRGTLGALLGDRVAAAEAGTWVLKPHGQWHTFWNPGDTTCEIIEIIFSGRIRKLFPGSGPGLGGSGALRPHAEVSFRETARHDPNMAMAGAANRISPEATAYPSRDARFVMNVHGRWDAAEHDERCISWARDFIGQRPPMPRQAPT